MNEHNTFQIGFTTEKFNDAHNDHAILTSAIPFDKMELFLHAALERIDGVLTAAGLVEHETWVTLCAPKTTVQSEDYKDIFMGARSKEKNFMTSELGKARVQFRFFCSWHPLTIDEAQLKKAQLYTDCLPSLGEAIKQAYEETASLSTM